MELKVWTDDGMLSVVSGVNIKTTCRDIMVAVAQATGGVGRYCMTICFKDICKRLNPSDKPIQILDGLGETWHKDARFFVSSSTKATHKLKSKLEDMKLISLSQKNLNELFDSDILSARASSESQNPKSHENDWNTIPQLAHCQTSLGDTKEFKTSVPYHHSDESNGTSSLEHFSSSTAFHPSKEHRFEQVNKLYLESLNASESDHKSTKYHQMQSEDRNRRLFISNERENYLKLQDRMILLKCESKKEDDIANFEMQKIEALLKSLAELQANNDKISKELEELELVSWKDKLQMEKSKEEKLQSDTKEAERNMETLSSHIMSLDNDISTIEQQIIAEEELKDSLINEIDELKQDLGNRSEKMKLQKALEELEANITFLHEILKQDEEEIIKERKKLKLIEADDAYSGHIA